MNYHEVNGESALLIDVANIYYKDERGEYVPLVYHGIPPAPLWGSITGLLSSQLDLQGVLDLKATKVEVALKADKTAVDLKADKTALDLKVDKVTGKVLSTNDYTTAEKTKLTGIAAGATANATDNALRDRTTHTGVQLASTVGALTGLPAGTNAVIVAADTLLVALGKLQAQINALKTP
ncbi:hypothetical protein SCYZ1_38 [Pseudomonas phage SCYZ1]|nr:hypothetical protein SCYZ1_38 [Pseudomonas phage SCYZ1]